MLVTTFAAAPAFASAELITVETNISRGIKFHLVGMADTAVRESRQRMYTALKNLNFRWPGQRITVNLIPAWRKKSGTEFDLAMAIGVLSASGQCSNARLGQYLLSGELTLNGGILPVSDAYNLADLAVKKGFKGMIMNTDVKVRDHFKARGLDLIACTQLKQVIAFLNSGQRPQEETIKSVSMGKRPSLCFSEVSGQRPLKRALAVAAAGGHHTIIVGPPGCGKTMLAQRMPSILPPVDPSMSKWVMRIAASTDGEMQSALRGVRPFVYPGRTLSSTALLGSDHRLLNVLNYALEREDEIWKGHDLPREVGAYMRALGGVLYLDEFGAFGKDVLDNLLTQLDHHHTTLIATMNPCRCGNHGHPTLKCNCTSTSLANYQNQFSGALQDRFDLFIQAQPTLYSNEEPEERSEVIAARVHHAWERQMERQGMQNSALQPDQLEAMMGFKKPEWRYLYQTISKLKLTTRGHHSLMAVARTIADLGGAERVVKKHIDAAVALRIPPISLTSSAAPAGAAGKRTGPAFAGPVSVILGKEQWNVRKGGV